MCDLCLEAYEPEEINGVRMLKVFNRYTVDLKLQQFRKVDYGREIEFVDFDNSKGQKLLKECTNL